ncbi:MAG TPA: hypothetical protein VEI07_03275 [Planctomycetaceae bacterium]|nr:hypothetical protein [Planctomycetaceae bacterium]
MSYDLMVFEPNARLRDRNSYMKWFEQEMRRAESYDPGVLTPKLRAWFHEMIDSFPPMNGPLASDDVDDPNLTEYGLGRMVIYASFAWSRAEAAFERVTKLATKHRVGFYDVSSGAGDIWVPTPDGNFEIVG